MSNSLNRDYGYGGNSLRVFALVKSSISGSFFRLRDSIPYALTDIYRYSDWLSIVSQHCVVYKFTSDLCDADYVGYTTARHLHQRIAEQKHSAIGKHLLLINEDLEFRVLKKCRGKFDCLVYEMLFIKELMLSLNTPQSDPITAKLFV